MNWLSVLIALLITYFLTPFIYQFSIELLVTFSRDHYGLLAPIIPIIWWICIFGSVGLISNLALKILLSGGAMNFIRRFV